MSKINWGHIKQIWLNGAEELSIIGEHYGVTMPEIAVRARSEKWGDRGESRPICEPLVVPILDDKQVMLAHKTDLGNLRLVAASCLEAVQMEVDLNVTMKHLEKLAKIYNIIIPLERKVFDMDGDTSDIPDGIVINVGNGG